MQYGLLHIILKEALKSDGCPICTLSVSVMNNYFYWLLYENVNALHIRKRLIESGGYCNAHAWSLYQTERREWADSMGTAIIYHDLIEDAIQGIERLSPKQRRTLFKDRWKGLFNKRKRSKEEGKQVLCPACSYQRQFEDIHINSLVEFLKLPEFQELYKTSHGLCLNHLRRALDSTQDEAIRSFLLEVQRGKIKILSEMLAEYIRKHDYRFANEPKGEEAKSPYRAIEMMVGKPLS